MKLTLELVLNSIFLGVGLAMDAFSVSVADGLQEVNMKKRKLYAIALTFAGFQFAMPLIGWAVLHTALERFQQLEKLIPVTALLLLAYVGGKMIMDGLKKDKEEEAEGSLTVGTVILQGIATSIDAISVGFTMTEYDLPLAFMRSVMIGIVTFVICVAGLMFGEKLGEKVADKAQFIGGAILILIGVEIFTRSL